MRGDDELGPEGQAGTEQGGYSPVGTNGSSADTGAGRPAPDTAGFRFTFLKDHFKIEEQPSVPREVLEAVLGGKTAEKIEGRFELRDERLILTGIRADGKEDFKDAKIHTFNTRVVRFDFGDVQYVLGPREQE